MHAKAHNLIRDLSILVCLIISLEVLYVGNRFIIRDQSKRDANSEATDPSRAGHSPSLPDVVHKGMWIWKSPNDFSDENLHDTFGVLSTDGFNTVYVDVSKYLEYYENQDQAMRTAQIAQLQNSLRVLVRSATSYGIEVHALAGDTSWGYADHAYIPPLFVDMVNTYNSTAQENEKLKGLQFDIESYNNQAFAADKKSALRQYMDMVNATINQYKNTTSSFALGFAVPYWFDNENGNIPEITRNKKTAPVVYHLADSLNTIKNSYIAIMDYRNTTDGKDGSIAHAQNEIVYTSKYAQNVHVVVAQESTNVQPAKITFYSKNKTDLMQALTRISTSFKPFSSYAGIALHDYDGYVRLRKKVE